MGFQEDVGSMEMHAAGFTGILVDPLCSRLRI
jgi:hypothetical protein